MIEIKRRQHRQRSRPDAAVASAPAVHSWTARRGRMSQFAAGSKRRRPRVRALRANLFRTVLTLLGIVIGVASVIAMLAIGDGAKKQVVDRPHQRHGHEPAADPSRRGRQQPRQRPRLEQPRAGRRGRDRRECPTCSPPCPSRENVTATLRARSDYQTQASSARSATFPGGAQLAGRQGHFLHRRGR